MKILLDENLDERLVALVPEHEVYHVHHMGWGNYKNGELMVAAAKEEFRVFVTADKNMPYQQNMTGRSFALIVLDIHPNKFLNQVECLPALSALLKDIQPGKAYTAKAPRS